METTKKALLLVSFNHEATTLNMSFGIPEERSREIIDWMEANVGQEGAKPSIDIEKVINEFDKPEELAYALYNLRPIEEEEITSSAFEGPSLKDAV